MSLQLNHPFDRPPGPSKNSRGKQVRDEGQQFREDHEDSPSVVSDPEDDTSVPYAQQFLPNAFISAFKADILKSVDHQTTDVFAQLAHMADDIKELTAVLPTIKELMSMIKDLRRVVAGIREELNIPPKPLPNTKVRNMGDEETRWIASEVINAIREDAGDTQRLESGHQCIQAIGNTDINTIVNQIFEKLVPFLQGAKFSLEDSELAFTDFTDNSSEVDHVVALSESFKTTSDILDIPQAGESYPTPVVALATNGCPPGSSDASCGVQMHGSVSIHPPACGSASNDKRTSHSQISKRSSSPSSNPPKPTTTHSWASQKGMTGAGSTESNFGLNLANTLFEATAQWFRRSPQVSWALAKLRTDSFYLSRKLVFAMISLLPIAVILLYCVRRYVTADEDDHPIWTALRRLDNTGEFDPTPFAGVDKRCFIM